MTPYGVLRFLRLDGVSSRRDVVRVVKSEQESGWIVFVEPISFPRKGSEAPYLIYEEDERLLQASNSSSKEIRDFLRSVGYHHCTQHGTDAHCTK